VKHAKKTALSVKKSGKARSVLRSALESTIATLAIAGIETPAYVYDLDAIEREADEIRAALRERDAVFYAVKANSAGSIIRAIASRGCGADVVTGAELALALRCGIAAEGIVYSGVAKSDDELDLAIASGERGIRAIQVESIEEIARVDARARAGGRNVRIAIRVNPGIDLGELETHAHIATGHDEAKFGVARADLGAALEAVKAASFVTLTGVSSHVGSQFFKTAPYISAARVVFELAIELRARGHALEFADTGGGFGVDYSGAEAARPATFVRETLALMKEMRCDHLALHVEPGRALVARHGVLVARVIQRKVSRARPADKWLMIDAGMNDLIRPALYQAKHRVVALGAHAPAASSAWRVVGPICESADDFGAHELPDEGFSMVALLDAGAYGYTMASRYNGRAVASEVFTRAGRIVGTSPRAPMTAWSDERSRV
jgi:diaminopimelate decarboxylase